MYYIASKAFYVPLMETGETIKAFAMFVMSLNGLNVLFINRVNSTQ